MAAVAAVTTVAAVAAVTPVAAVAAVAAVTTVTLLVGEKGKVSSFITHYPVLRTAQSTLHFTSLADLFNQTPSWLLWEASSHAAMP